MKIIPFTDKELVQNKHEIAFKSNVPIKMGQVLYRIEKTSSIHYYGTCEVCKGEKQITVNGYTFTCPKCNGGSGSMVVLIASRYQVQRYRVQKISEELDMNSWGEGKEFTKYVSITAFRPRPRNNARWDENDKSFKLSSIYIGQTCFDNILDEIPQHEFVRDEVYADYKLAVQRADMLNEQSKKKVDEYNANFGTNFEFEFPAYDRKSN